MTDNTDALPEPDCWAVLTPNGSKLVSPDEAKGLHKAYPLFTADQLRAALASRDAEIAKLKGWRDAIDEALVVAHIGVATEPYDDLNKLLQWHHDIWLDPAVSSDAAALVEQGRAEIAKLRQGEPVAWRYKGAGWERWIYCTNPPRNTRHEYIVEPLYASPPPAQPAQPIQAHSKAQYKRLVAQGANALPPQPPQAEPLSEADIVRCAVESGCVGTVKMTFDSGPYHITRTSINADRFTRAIERLITERMSAGGKT